MKKLFSSRVGNIEVVVEETLELSEGDKMARVVSRKGRVIKHGMGRSRTIVNYKDYEAFAEANHKFACDSMRWHIRESANEWNKWNNRKGETK